MKSPKYQRNHRMRSLLYFLLLLALSFPVNVSAGPPAFYKSGQLPNLTRLNLVSTATANLNTGRYDHTATLLLNGKVLVTGGVGATGNYFKSQNTAELYEPTAGTWTGAGSMLAARSAHTATLLMDGRVLVAGGNSTSGGESIATAELYDPISDSWKPAGNLSGYRSGHLAVLLPDGRLLVAGGIDKNGPGLVTAELFDPASESWNVTASMSSTHRGGIITLLPTGKVLVAGGYDTAGRALENAELYDPTTGAWAFTGRMATARAGGTASLLASGKVLVAGGSTATSGVTTTAAELYDPITGTWSNTGRLVTARTDHTATLLPNGKVLLAGGVTDNFATRLKVAEIYDPGTGLWQETIGLETARSSHTATLLPDGKVLVAGGFSTEMYPLASVELYQPSGEPSFSADLFKTKWQRADKPVADGTASPSRSWLWGPTSFNPATGSTEPYHDTPGGTRTVQYFDKARMELNNPATGLVTNGLLVRELISGRLATGDSSFIQRHPASDIPIAGDPTGNNGPTYSSFGKVATTDNDNPASDRTGQPVIETLNKEGTIGTNPAYGSYTYYSYFEGTLKHNIPEVFWNFLNQQGNIYTGGQLNNNQPVLGDNPVAPWLDATGYPISEAYWSTVNVAGKSKLVLTQAYERRVLTFTPDNPAGFKVEMGNVGRHYFSWRYDPKYDSDNMLTARAAHSATLLPDGKVLVAGGGGQKEYEFFASAELFDPVTGSWSSTGSMTYPHVFHSAILLPGGKVLVVGNLKASPELYNPSTGTWSRTGQLTTDRYNPSVTLLPEGKVLVAGGYHLATAELYDPVAGTWKATGSMGVARQAHTATLLLNGKVLVAGGNGQATAELYDPVTGTWKATGSLHGSRYNHTATLLPDGKVLVAGGEGENGSLDTAELYDPATGTWRVTGEMGEVRHNFTATLLPGGKVLAVGGNNQILTELYDPASGIWSPAGNLNSARSFHTATLLPDGKVLVTGGQKGPSTILSSTELYDPVTGVWNK